VRIYFVVAGLGDFSELCFVFVESSVGANKTNRNLDYHTTDDFPLAKHD